MVYVYEILEYFMIIVFFFFKAKDAIRDIGEMGVKPWALPTSPPPDSRPLTPASAQVRNRLEPPSWATAASKLTRVRNDGFSNTSVITRPPSNRGRSPCSNLYLTSAARRRIFWKSWELSRVNVSKCFMANFLLTA